MNTKGKKQTTGQPIRNQRMKIMTLLFGKASALLCVAILLCLSANVGLAATKQDYLDSAKLLLDGPNGNNGTLAPAI